MSLLRFYRFLTIVAAVVVVSASAVSTSAATAPSEAEQLRIIHAMSELLRARIDQLPVLIDAGYGVGKVAEKIVTLNREAVVVEGQRFDGVVVIAPKEKASYAWAFAAPANSASWYILREKGDMKGFANFLRRPRSAVPLASEMKPESVTELTFQNLGSASWVAGERYVLWFRFKDDVPATLTLRAGFFAKSSLNNNALPALLFPSEKP
jgi:hypothetical protein